MNVELNPNQEQIISQAMQAGLIQTIEEVIEAGVADIRRRLDAHVVVEAPISAEAWSRELNEWIDSHATGSPLLSEHAISRDSIYGTRGQ
jgi:hypothetical protein